MTASRELSVSIDCPLTEAYEFLSLPENFPKWASGLDTSLTVRFSERNSSGVLDHWVTLPDGTSIHIPLRVVAKGSGCELVLTLIRQPGMSDEKFAADAEWVKRDLLAAKRILEAQKT